MSLPQDSTSLCYTEKEVVISCKTLEESSYRLFWAILKNEGLEDTGRKREGEDSPRQLQESKILLIHSLPGLTMNPLLGKHQKGPNPVGERNKNSL